MWLSRVCPLYINNLREKKRIMTNWIVGPKAHDPSCRVGIEI